MNKLKGVLIDGKHHEIVEIDNNLESIYKLLGVDCIDITRRQIVGKDYCIICDDEGLLKENIISSLYIDDNFGFKIAFVGKIFVVGFDGKEDVCSLTESEITHLLFNIAQGVLFIY